MKPIEPLPIRHGWPIYEQGHRFALGRILHCTAREQVEPVLGGAGAGQWECDLARNALTWSNEVYDIFGLPRGARVSRDEAVSLYCEHSRAVMEGLRAYAIKQKLGFVLDAEIRPGHGPRRWMRLVAAPVLDGNMVMRLQGTKQIIE